MVDVFALELRWWTDDVAEEWIYFGVFHVRVGCTTCLSSVTLPFSVGTDLLADDV